MNNIIEIDHLCKSFGEVKAVHDLSFRVKEGELFAFLGVVKSHPINMWNHKTFILRGENDTLCEYNYVKAFADCFSCELTEQKGGEHWFHTDCELDFFRNWIRERLN